MQLYFILRILRLALAVMLNFLAAQDNEKIIGHLSVHY